MALCLLIYAQFIHFDLDLKLMMNALIFLSRYPAWVIGGNGVVVVMSIGFR